MKKMFLLMGLVVVGLFIAIDNQYNNAVEECVNNGGSVEICESGLR